MFDVKRRIYLRVNIKTFRIEDVHAFDSSLMQYPAEIAMSYFHSSGGPLSEEEELFSMVDSVFTHNYKRKH